MKASVSEYMRCWLLLVFIGIVPLAGAAEDTHSEFLRFIKTGEQEGHVDTALTTYRAPNGVEVALVSALHIGDLDYYEELNQRFEKYDAVLYEMIKDTRSRRRSEPPRRGMQMVGQMQVAMKSMLGLEFQLDRVDYSPKNFVHADMDARTFSQFQKKKGENFFTLMLQSVLQERQMRLSGSGQPMSPFDLLNAFSSDDRAHSLKWLFAQQLEQIETMMMGMDQGMDGKGSVILTERNRVAMRVLSEQLREKKRRVAIFYGAGHMPDLEKRLLAHGFRKVREEWLLAWDLRR